MSQLSSCIFEWDAEDYQQLLKATEAELVAAGIQHAFFQCSSEEDSHQ
jgi:hypothetical protein